LMLIHVWSFVPSSVRSTRIVLSFPTLSRSYTLCMSTSSFCLSAI
jgi:hypothetical protein